MEWQPGNLYYFFPAVLEAYLDEYKYWRHNHLIQSFICKHIYACVFVYVAITSKKNHIISQILSPTVVVIIIIMIITGFSSLILVVWVFETTERSNRP